MSWTRIKILALVLRTRPLSVVIPAALIPIGGVATILGPDSSRAFSVLPEGAQFIAHAMGLFMALGGALVLLALANTETFTELIGLVLYALGCLIYGAGVIIGLGVNGLITGPMFLAIAGGAMTRVVVVARMSARVARNGIGDSPPG